MRRTQRAIREAKRVLMLENVKRAPVKIEQIARKHAQIVEVEMDDEISGMLVPVKKPVNGKSWVIVVNNDHVPVRKRFTIAHELGHLLLHGYTTPHADKGFRVRMRSNASSDGTIAEEIEANRFAAELLMPTDFLLKRLLALNVDYADEDDEELKSLAAEFKGSRQALIIRVSELLA